MMIHPKSAESCWSTFSDREIANSFLNPDFDSESSSGAVDGGGAASQSRQTPPPTTGSPTTTVHISGPRLQMAATLMFGEAGKSP